MNTPTYMLLITSCSDPRMWYANMVGQLVPLMRFEGDDGWMSQEPGGHSNIVRKLDAEVVTIEVSPRNFGRWPYITPTHKLVQIVPASTPKTEASCKARCDMLGVCRALPDCEEALAQARHTKPPAQAPAMGQSRRASMWEAVTNIAVGFVVSMVLQAVVLPAYGHHITLSQNFQITVIFTVASLLRSYGVRRVFNHFLSRS